VVVVHVRVAQHVHKVAGLHAVCVVLCNCQGYAVCYLLCQGKRRCSWHWRLHYVNTIPLHNTSDTE
jgi:hypothetical protein